MLKKQDNKSQKDKFIETARALGCDESEEAFVKKLKDIASVKPKDESKKKTGKPKIKGNKV